MKEPMEPIRQTGTYCLLRIVVIRTTNHNTCVKRGERGTLVKY